MAGLADVIRGAVAIADKITGSLQVTVQHYRWNGVDSTGMPTFTSPVNRKALVNRQARRVRTDAGDEVVSNAHVIFLKPIAPLTVAESAGGPRHNPIDKRDKILIPLPGGGTLTGPILTTSGFVDAGATVTGQTFIAEAFLG